MSEAKANKININEDIEIHLFLEAMFLKYGYDFRGYSRAHIKRRLLKRMVQEKLENIMQLTDRLLNSKSFLEAILMDFSINATEMYRDPEFFLKLKNEVFPILNTYPQLRIWIAGCASGEEIYSLAILLKESGMLEKSVIYATDINEKILSVAKEGIYPINLIKEYSKNYLIAGGKDSLSDYYTAKYDSVKMNKNLMDNIVFSTHNLVTDGSFSDMHLILCRNVMIYFDKYLKSKTLNLFYETLNKGCFLCLGIKENLSFSNLTQEFSVFSESEKIYRKK